MLVRPKYTSEEGTPLFFLKFLKIVLPIGIILRLFVLVSLFSQEFSAYSLLYCAANLALAFVAAVYLNKMEWKGVLAFYGIFAVQIADKTLEFLLLTSYGLPPSVGTVIGTVLGELVVLVPVIVYFDKRRLLFAPPPKKLEYTPAIPKGDYDQQEHPKEWWYTCPKCGQLVREGAICDCSAEGDRQQVESASMSVGSNAIEGQQQKKPIVQGSGQKKMSDAAKGRLKFISLIALAVALVLYLNYDSQKTPAPDEAEEKNSGDLTLTDGRTGQTWTSEPQDPALTPESVYNGKIITWPDGEQLAPLSIATKGDKGFYVILDGDDYMSFYVAADSVAEVEVPLGFYEIYYATGDIWYGKKNLFGADTTYHKCEGDFEFYNDGTYYQGWSLELYLQRDGNMSTETITVEEFPA